MKEEPLFIIQEYQITQNVQNDSLRNILHSKKFKIIFLQTYIKNKLCYDLQSFSYNEI